MALSLDDSFSSLWCSPRLSQTCPSSLDPIHLGHLCSLIPEVPQGPFIILRVFDCLDTLPGHTAILWLRMFFFFPFLFPSSLLVFSLSPLLKRFFFLPIQCTASLFCSFSIGLSHFIFPVPLLEWKETGAATAVPATQLLLACSRHPTGISAGVSYVSITNS